MNEFIKEYQKLRDEGYDCYRAFNSVAGHISLLGTLDDLRDLYNYQTQEIFNELEELANERDQVTQSKVS